MMEPRVREYLNTLRQDSYVIVHPGYVDSARCRVARPSSRKCPKRRQERAATSLRAKHEKKQEISENFLEIRRNLTMKSSLRLQPRRPTSQSLPFFVVHEKEIRATREGRHYLRLELGDRTGTVEARMWTGFEDFARRFSRDDFVKVQARVEMYRNRPQLMVDRLRRAELSEVDFADFFAHTSANVDDLWQRLRAHAESVRNPWLRQLLGSVFDDVGDRRTLSAVPPPRKPCTTPILAACSSMW